MRASAGFGIRFLSRFVDLVYGLVLSLVTGVGATVVFVILKTAGKIPENWLELIQVNYWHTYGFSILGGFLYYSFSEGSCGATIGKLVCGLRVVQTDGRPCTVAGAFKRDLAYHWDALFVGLVAYAAMKDSPMQQRYGDRWAQTVVVKHARFAADPALPTWRFPAGIITGSLFWILCQFVGLCLKVF